MRYISRIGNDTHGKEILNMLERHHFNIDDIQIDDKHDTGTVIVQLSSSGNLTDNQKVKLGSLEKLNLKINRAYLLKEAFRNLWFYKTTGWAYRYLKQWVIDVLAVVS